MTADQEIVLESCLRYIVINLIDEDKELIPQYETLVENVCKGAFNQKPLHDFLPLPQNRTLLLSHLKSLLEKYRVPRKKDKLQQSSV